MTVEQDYWFEYMASAAEDAGLVLTNEQLSYFVEAAESGHEHYGYAFYSPSYSSRISEIEQQWEEKYERLLKEFQDYKANAETVVKRVMGARADSRLSIEPEGCISFW